MATSGIVPALEMAQESGLLVSWLKRDGEPVVKGEPLMEIETDKVTVEIDAPASGFLGGILAKEGDVVPVGQTIAWILASGERPPVSAPQNLTQSGRVSTASTQSEFKPQIPSRNISPEISPLARNIAEEYDIDLALVKPSGKRIEKADVLAYINATHHPRREPVKDSAEAFSSTRLTPASPKARRLATELGIDIKTIKGSGPDNAILAADIRLVEVGTYNPEGKMETPSTVWRLMAERMTASWTTVPHFYLIREVDAGNFIEWRTHIMSIVEKRSGVKPTFTDLLVKLIGFTLREHPRVNAAWVNGDIQFNKAVNVGIAVALDDGLIVPVIRDADSASIGDIAKQRRDLIDRAQNRKLHPIDISDGTFTLSNLGMYNVDAFNAIINTPQAAILAVGRIAERVVPIKGQIVIRSMMIVSLSCDHRVVDGVRAARFLDDLTNLIEDPWGLLG